jgi:hypothetical protein
MDSEGAFILPIRAAAMGEFQNVHGENPVHQLRPRIVVFGQMEMRGLSHF